MTGVIKQIVTATLAEMDPDLSPGDEGWPYAAILATSLMIGASEQSIVLDLGLDPDFVEMVGRRLRDSGIWSGESVTTVGDYQDDESGGTSFWMDASVASGDMKRHPDGRYSMTDAGRSRVKAMMQ